MKGGGEAHGDPVAPWLAQGSRESPEGDTGGATLAMEGPQEGASGSRGAVGLQILNCNMKVSKDMWSPVHNIHMFTL